MEVIPYIKFKKGEKREVEEIINDSKDEFDALFKIMEHTGCAATDAQLAYSKLKK